jgi:hypothetical protein
MMAGDNPISRKSLAVIWPDLLLTGFVFYMAFLYVGVSGTRCFNFDEFEVLYAGASLLRGKTLYAAQIEPHFPIFNICIAQLVNLSGFNTTAIIIARYFVLLTSAVALVFTYKIGKIIWDKRTGLIAVCLVLSSIVFLNKGLEIRHDVFNMTFNVIAAYYGLRYIQQKRYLYIILSAIFLGVAFASTQKAVVWNLGIIIGLALYYLRDKSYKDVSKIALYYLLILFMPLLISLFYLVFSYGDNVHMFLSYAVAKQIIFYSPYAQELYPFPYNRYDLFKDLIFQNHLLYALSIGGMSTVIIRWVKSNTERIVIAVWALTGILFYITVKRPFFQTFLPSVVPMSILATGLLADLFKEYNSLNISKKAGIGITVISLLFVWPLFLANDERSDNDQMMRQMDNITFCLENLKNDDKVLCFTGNQIFFEPVFKIDWEEGGTPIYDYDPTFFENKMINEQCKVIINDYRTGLLSEKVKKKIRENYLPVNNGDIFVPGLTLEPGETIDKKVWIEGYYYSPIISLEIDQKKIESKLIKLEQRRYRIKNNTNRRISLIYIFDKDKFLTDSTVGL